MTEQEQNETTSPQEMEMEAKSKPSPIFLNTFTRYANSIDALREFSSRLNPFVVKMQKGIAKQRKAYMKEIIGDFMGAASKEEIEGLDNFLEAVKPRVTKKDSQVRVSKAVEIKSPLVAEFALKLSKLFSHSATSDIHRKLLNRSILMSLVSYFEVLVADLGHAFFRIAPDAAFTEEKRLSVKELNKFSTIDEAVRFVVSDAVDELLRGSVTDWQKFFQTRIKIDMKLLPPDWARWNEYFQRRHIVVHAGGRVTERYLSNVDWEKLDQYMTVPSLGHELDIDDAYISDAINAFEVCGLLLCQEVWRKLAPGDEEARYSSLTGLLDSVYRRLLSRHWYVAEKLATWGEKDSEASEDSMLICKFNRWLCIKRQERWAEVEDEVRAFDCSAKNRRYALVRASLLERADEFFDLLPKALGTDIDLAALKEWPILDEMRTDPRFAKVIEGAEQ